jgi:LPXTG-motif cell wall-anchored protein
MVNSNQTTPIKDKNELSTVDKVAGSEYSADAKKAIQAVGNDQPFTVQITKKHGTSHIVFNDTMTNMTYNSDLTVTVRGQTVAAGDTTYNVTPATGNAGLTVKFDDSYIQGLDDNTVITLNYTAKITSEALQTDPAKNSASLTLDNGNTTTTSDVEVYNGKITVTKTDGKKQPLEGAGFKLKNSEGKYYTLTNGVVSFTDNGTEVMADDTDSKNVAVFAGLPAGTYTLEESTVPAGYNKADDQTITITAGVYTVENLSKTATVVNNAGSTLPSTGGMGTTIFYVLGAALVIGAGVVLVTRKRLSK